MSPKKKKKTKKALETKSLKAESKLSLPEINKKAWYLCGGLITFIAFILYFQCIPYGYVLDDKIVITENTYTKNGLSGLVDIFTKDSFSGYFGEQKDLLQGGRYRPLSIASFAVEYQLFGLNEKISHFINILLYALSCILMLFTLKRLFSEDQSYSKHFALGISFLAGMIFLVHPLHTEAVANIKGRDEIMAFIFGMWALKSSLNYVDYKKNIHLLSTAFVLFLGLLSKENVITFLAVIPVSILLFRKVSSKQILAISGVLLSTVLVYLFFRFLVIGYLLGGIESKDVMNNPFANMNGSQKYATIFYTLLMYLKLSVVPHPLTHDYYPYHIPIMEWSNIWVIISAVFHVLLAGASLLLWKKNPIVSFSILFYLLTISIVSNLFVGVGTFMNERFVFISSLGVCVFIAYLINKLYQKGFQKPAIVISCIILAAFAVLTIMRVPAWESELTLNKAAIKVSKNSARANSFMSTALFNQYKDAPNSIEKKRLLDEASVYVEKAIRLIPEYSNPYLMKAGIAAERHKMGGSLEDLLRVFREVINVKPKLGFVTEYLKYINDREDASTLIDFYFQVGYKDLIIKKKNYNWGLHYLNFGYEIDPDDENIKRGRYAGYKAQGKVE